MLYEAKEHMFCEAWSSSLAKSFSHTRLISPCSFCQQGPLRPNRWNPPARLGRAGRSKNFSPPVDTKAPFCRHGSNRYFVNRGLNDSTQMIDGAAGAFAVFYQYQAHTHMLFTQEFDQSQSMILGKPPWYLATTQSSRQKGVHLSNVSVNLKEWYIFWFPQLFDWIWLMMSYVRWT